MNKFIKEQLDACKIARLPAYSDDTTTIMIKRQTTGLFNRVEEPVKTESQLIFKVNHFYLIEIADSLITPGRWYSTIHDQWNHGLGPKDKIFNCQVVQQAGKMIKIDGISDNGIHWIGWLPQGNVKLIEEL